MKGETYLFDLDDKETKNEILSILDRKKDLRSDSDIAKLMIYTSSIDFKPPNEAKDSQFLEKLSEEDKKYICEVMTLKVC